CNVKCWCPRRPSYTEHLIDITKVQRGFSSSLRCTASLDKELVPAENKHQARVGCSFCTLAGLKTRTPATPNGLLLTPSPLLSSIHFWSSLSPVAPLSPARLQGPSTLFQFPTLLNGHMPVPIPSLDRAASPVLLSSNSQKS
uniref:ETS transcription factor ELK3 n=1 Tax=Ovis aries TaxID=9940 RepID=A0AC11EBX6_SHEEP